MKNKIIIGLVCGLIVTAMIFTSGCVEQNMSQEDRIVTDKISSMENRFSVTDFALGDGSITKSQSVYYLISNIKKCEVSMIEFSNVNIGDHYSCDWVTG